MPPRVFSEQYLPVTALVKFTERDSNRQRTGPQSPFGVISHTFGKAAILDPQWRPAEGVEPPKPNTFWFVRVCNETHPGQNRGVYVLQPIERVLESAITLLLPIPSHYTMSRPLPNIMVIEPKDAYGYVMMGLEFRRKFRERERLNAILVISDGVPTSDQSGSVERNSPSGEQKQNETEG